MLPSGHHPPFALPTSPAAWEEILAELFTAKPKLSEREIQVLARRILGADETDIARELYLHPGSVKRYQTSLMNKTELSSVRELGFYTFNRLWQRYRITGEFPQRKDE